VSTRRLGNSDLNITPVGFGAWAIGGTGYDFAWGKQDDADSIAAVHRSLELGVNWFDTAPVYGTGAIAWTLRLPAITCAIVGARNARQAEGVMRAGELELTPQDIAEIEGTTAAHAGR